MFRAISTPLFLLFLVGASQGQVKTPPKRSAELAKLEWMVGSWVHEAEGAVAKMSAKWSENGQFLLREFEIKLGATEALHIRQTLYWDPIEKKLRSSGFSSDGSVESGLWVVVGTQVHNKRRLTYPDGRVATATNKWTATSTGRCVFTSTDRLTDKERMPDLAPIELEQE